MQGWGWQDWHWGVPTAVQQEVKLANIKKEEKIKSVQQEVDVIKKSKYIPTVGCGLTS